MVAGEGGAAAALDEAGRQFLAIVAARLNGYLTKRRQRSDADWRQRVFGALVSMTDDAVAVIDAEDFRFLEVNRAACRQLGYSEEELRALRSPAIQAEFDEDEMRRRTAEMQTGERKVSYRPST
ncbi:PAS domain S-box protein [Pseudohaliea rubra]|uniref:PAS domain S-box protein n=1 Tax=Pseudohaliea rubra TaxID=475795 RepID=UPI001184D448|nr:PAS domain S-box protein [Pseudohaliea rubra]